MLFTVLLQVCSEPDAPRPVHRVLLIVACFAGSDKVSQENKGIL